VPGCGTTSTQGQKRCPIVDQWWQTETAPLYTPLPGLMVPGSTTYPFPMALWTRRTRRCSTPAALLIIPKPLALTAQEPMAILTAKQKSSR